MSGHTPADENVYRHGPKILNLGAFWDRNS
jgi:hypothetical protein